MLEVARPVSGWAEIKRKLDAGERLTVEEARLAHDMVIYVPPEQAPAGLAEPDVDEQVEAADVTDEELRECVAAIRAGQAVDLPGVDEEFALAVIRYANGLPPADSAYSAAVWEAARHAVEGKPLEDAGEFAHGAMRSVAFATEILLAASLPDLAERVGALIGVALVTSGEDLASPADLNHAAEVVLAILANPEGAAGSRALHTMFAEASRRAGERGISGEESLSGWLLSDSEVELLSVAIGEALVAPHELEKLDEQMREAVAS